MYLQKLFLKKWSCQLTHWKRSAKNPGSHPWAYLVKTSALYYVTVSSKRPLGWMRRVLRKASKIPSCSSKCLRLQKSCFNGSWMWQLQLNPSPTEKACQRELAMVHLTNKPCMDSWWWDNRRWLHSQLGEAVITPKPRPLHNTVESPQVTSLAWCRSLWVQY